MINREKLRELAEKATPGPWVAMSKPSPSYSDHGYRRIAETPLTKAPLVYAYASNMVQEGKGYAWGGDAPFIAAANPETILALLDALEAAEGVNQWRSIDTAPMDGTPLILFARYIHATAPVICVGWYIDSMWINASFGGAAIQQIVPSHWMPEPAFPAIDAARKA